MLNTKPSNVPERPGPCGQILGDGESCTAAYKASHAMWFPSLPVRNLVLARAQFRNGTGGMTQQVKCLIKRRNRQVGTTIKFVTKRTRLCFLGASVLGQNGIAGCFSKYSVAFCSWSGMLPSNSSIKTLPNISGVNPGFPDCVVNGPLGM
jgi:hypothetical protein